MEIESKVRHRRAGAYVHGYRLLEGRPVRQSLPIEQLLRAPDPVIAIIGDLMQNAGLHAFWRPKRDVTLSPGKGAFLVKILLDEASVQRGVRKLATDVESVFADRPLTIVGLMTGSIVLLADLIRQLKMPLRVGVLQTSSYRSGTHRQDLQINGELKLDIADRDVLVIDDIFDTGHTLCQVMGMLGRLEPRSIRSAVLLRKSGRREVDFQPDFVVFEIPDEFVVGYGLDYCDQYRNLPFVAALEPADMGSV